MALNHISNLAPPSCDAVTIAQVNSMATGLEWQPMITDFDFDSPIPVVKERHAIQVRGPRFKGTVVLIECGGKWEPLSMSDEDEDVKLVKDILTPNSIRFMKDLENEQQN